MNVTEKSAEGLSREFHVVIPQTHLSTRLDAKLEEVKGQVHLKGFRPGKAPLSFLKKMYGKGMMSELIQEEMAAAQEKAFGDAKIRPAMPPHPHFEDGIIEKVIEGDADLEYDIHVEVLPDFEPIAIDGLSFQKKVTEVPDDEVDEELKKIAEQNTQYAARDEGAAAENGDQLEIDFVGKIDGEPFDGGAGEYVPIVLGSQSFIPGFEEQLLGVTAGEEKTITVTFPEEYGAPHLAGKEATFDITVHAVKAPKEATVDDQLAQSLGMEDLDQLKARVREQVEGRFETQSRLHLKRDILDLLDEKHEFDLPPGMVEAEFNQIWSQVENVERDEEDKEKSEDDLKADYRKIAERRVRLGLVLAEIGKEANVTVPDQDLQRQIQMQAMQAGVPVQQVIEFLQQNPAALAQIRAPLFEDKVIDHIIEKAEIAETTVSREELMKDPGEDEPAPAAD